MKNKILRYLAVGLSVVLLLNISQFAISGDLFRQGEKIAEAQEYEGDGTDVGEVTEGPDQPISDDGSEDSNPKGEQGEQGDYGTPYPSPYASPPTPSSCPYEFKYNECVACNTSHPVSQDCRGDYQAGPNQTDNACASWCATTPTPTPTIQPTPTPIVPTPTPVTPSYVYPTPYTYPTPYSYPTPYTYPPPVVTAPQTARQNVEVKVANNNANSNNNTNTVGGATAYAQGGSANVTISQPASQKETVKEIRVVTAQTPRVVQVAGVKTEVKELPKTGLPILAYAVGVFVPLGLRLRKFDKSSPIGVQSAHY